VDGFAWRRRRSCLHNSCFLTFSAFVMGLLFHKSDFGIFEFRAVRAAFTRYQPLPDLRQTLAIVLGPVRS
jgi:hypothetical protein